MKPLLSLPSSFPSMLSAFGARTAALAMVAGAIFAAPNALGQQGAVWTSPTAGTLGGSSFTVTGLSNAFVVSSDYSGSDYGAGPLGINQQDLVYDLPGNFTITFSPPILNPRIYTAAWRGTGAFHAIDYTFNVAPVIASGLGSASLNGSILHCPTTDYHSGILEFPGLISTLSVTSTASCCSSQAMTLGYVPGPCDPVAFADIYEDNDSCATAASLSDGTHSGLTAQKADSDFYSFCVPDQATVSFEAVFLNSVSDLDLMLWESTATPCGSTTSGAPLVNANSTSDNEAISWTNTTGSDVTVILELYVWNNPSNGDCNNYDLVVTGTGCSPFATFCDPANVNCNGTATTLNAEIGTGVGSGLRLSASGGAPNQFGYYLVSAENSEPGTAVSNGKLCIGGIIGGAIVPIGRYNSAGTSQNSLGQFNSDGSQFINLSGTGTSLGDSVFDVPSTLPLPGSLAISSGDTWCFQLWHRDNCSGTTGSNFSNGISVTF